MSNPSTRTEFKEYCLRELGWDVIEINVSDEQIEDRIDEALSMYHEHHYDAVETIYTSHQLTANNVTDKYISMPDSVMGVTKIFPVGSINSGNYSGANPFSLAYQLRVSDMYTFFSNSMLDYWLYKRHLSLIEEILSGQVPIRFNKVSRRLYLDGNYDTVLLSGAWIVIECQKYLDPDTFSAVWKNNWLKRYATALIKRQWGTNLGKYTEVRLPGGVILNGPGIFAEAKTDIEALEHELQTVWSLPPSMMVG
jgi:hypothetical protein